MKRRIDTSITWICATLLMLSSAFVPKHALAQDLLDRVTLHGYLTQAYGVTDNLPVDGLDKGGTWDYRVASLQMRYAISDNGEFVVQVRNRRLGNSLLSDNGIDLSWAYYRHNFGSTSVKVGLDPLPLGIYNELRLVGTVLPFFRAPDVFYLPGVESISGVTVGNHLGHGTLSLESTLYLGSQITRNEIQTPSGPFILENHGDNIMGVQEWLNTPIPGLRLGGTYLRFKAPTADLTDTLPNNLVGGSLDGTFDRFFARGEYMRYRVIRGIPTGDVVQVNYYGQAGVKLLEPLWLNAQAEVNQNNYGSVPFRGTDDKAVGVLYKANPEMVFKLEGHRATGYNFDKFMFPPMPQGKTYYGIASMSVSF